jgi:alcohol dehydrogenase
MQNFLLRVPPFLAFGQDVLPRLGAIAREHGKRALIVSEGVLHEGNHVDRVVEILKRAGMETMVYDELMPHRIVRACSMERRRTRRCRISRFPPRTATT